MPARYETAIASLLWAMECCHRAEYMARLRKAERITRQPLHLTCEECNRLPAPVRVWRSSKETLDFCIDYYKCPTAYGPNFSAVSNYFAEDPCNSVRHNGKYRIRTKAPARAQVYSLEALAEEEYQATEIPELEETI